MAKRNGLPSAEYLELLNALMGTVVPRGTKREKRRPRTALISYAAQRRIAEHEGRG